MCQLTAYIGDRPIAPLLLTALELQEPYYAGHATGIGVINSGKINIVKATGPVSKVNENTPITELVGNTGIGHSRYSSKAKDDPRFDVDAMAHPFTNEDETIALMHNGVIQNYKEHWEKLKPNHVFKSYSPKIDWITDSEVAVHMLSDLVNEGLSIEESLKQMFPKLSGTILLCVIHESEPDVVYLANRHQPCYVGIGDDEIMWCSSKIGLSPIVDELKKVYRPPKNSLMKLTRGNIETQVLDPDYKVPNLTMNKDLVKEKIMSIVSVGEIDFRNLWNAINYGGGWAKAYGVTVEEAKEHWKNGFTNVNDYIETIDELIQEGKITQRVDYRLEGSTANTPRFAYRLA
jgi:glucosamine 6-phosphate synthetase-like amidotransferase/phosphosugar isomerase protein